MNLMLIPKLLLVAALTVFSLYGMFLYFFKYNFIQYFLIAMRPNECTGQDKLCFHWYALSTMESMNRPGGVEAD